VAAATAAVAATAAGATATAAATTAAAEAASAATAATAAAAGAFFTRAGNVDRQIPSVESGAVHRLDGLLGFFRTAHGDETEPAWTSAHAVDHQVGFHDRAMGRKGVLQVIFSSVEGKISYKQFGAHVMLIILSDKPLHRLFPNAGFRIITELEFT
jgi:hypothetical protein